MRKNSQQIPGRSCRSTRIPPLLETTGLFCLLLASLLSAAPCRAASSASLTDQGNKAYAAAEYEKALDLYNRAAEKGESAIIDYNRGNALYRLGDFAGAQKAYAKAATDRKKEELAASSYYNMGNAAFRQGASLSQQYPDQAIRLFTESAAAYRETLRMAPAFSGAGANLELANRKIKELTAQLQKQRKPIDNQGKSSDQEQGKGSPSLQDLAERQKQLAGETKKLQNSEQGDEERQQTADTIAEGQEQLRRETEARREQVADQDQTGQARKNLEEATGLQQKAEEKLRANQLQDAAEMQKKAAAKLTGAADSERQPAEKKDDPGKKQKQGEEQPRTGAKPQSRVDNRPAAADQEDGTSPPELDPAAILNQEKMQRQLRLQKMSSPGVRRVEKDW